MRIILTALIVLLTCTVVNASDFVFSFGFGYGSPVVYTQPYVYAPAPVVYAPAPVIYTAPYVYTAPIYRHPVIVHSPAPRHYGPIFGHRPDVRPHGPIFNRPSPAPRGPMHQGTRGGNGPGPHSGPRR